jgi:hypothetical protein
MCFNKLTPKLFIIVNVLIIGILLSIGLLFLFRSQASIALASYGQGIEKAEGVNIPFKVQPIGSAAMAPFASQPISGVVIVPADSNSYSIQIYTAPLTVDFVIISATATWSDDWHTPLPTETTQSYPNIVEIPYLGGTGCDYIYNYDQNNFAKISLDAQDQFSQESQTIRIGPGKSVAIAGSDCGLNDNFHAHYHIAWMATVQHQIFLPLAMKAGN